MRLPSVALLRRADTADVIVQALIANAEGEGHRPIAARREQTVTHAIRTMISLDAGLYRFELKPGWNPSQLALVLLAAAGAMIQRVVDKVARSLLEVVSGMCAGLLLANTSCPYPWR